MVHGCIAGRIQNYTPHTEQSCLFIYENNQFSVCSRVSDRQAGKVLFHYIPPHQMYTNIVDGNLVMEVYKTAKIAVKRARSGQGPSFIECKTYRIRGHAGPGSDAKLGYRTAEEIVAWEAKCPVMKFRDQLLFEGVITEKKIAEIGKEIDAEIDEAFQFAKKSPFPKKEDLHLYLFRE